MATGWAPRSPQTTRWGIALIVGLAGLAVWRWFAFGAPYGGDWAQYMLHARALAEGRQYGDIGYLFSPAAWLIGPPIYPPGLPLVLTPVVLIFGESTLVPRLVMHALLGLFLWSAYRVFSRDEEPELAWAMVALLGTGFLIADVANVVGADLGMCALVWLAIALAERDDSWSASVVVTVGALGALAIMFRIAAMPLIPAIGLWVLLRWRRAGFGPWVVGVAWVVTLAWMLYAFGPGGQAAQAFAGTPAPGELSDSDTTSRFLNRLAARIGTYRLALSAIYLYPFPFRLGNHVYHLLAVPLTAIGLWSLVRSGWSRFAFLFGAMTVAMLMTIPVWTGRYAWIVAPFACYGLARGIAWVVRHIAGRTAIAGGGESASPERWAYVVCIAIAGLAAINTPAPTGARVDADDWRAVGSYLAETVPTESLRVVSNRPRVMTWYTEIPAMGLPVSTLEVFLSEARRFELTRLVVSTQPSEERLYGGWERWKRDYPDVFRLLHVEGTVEVYDITRFEP